MNCQLVWIGVYDDGFRGILGSDTFFIRNIGLGLAHLWLKVSLIDS